MVRNLKKLTDSLGVAGADRVAIDCTGDVPPAFRAVTGLMELRVTRAEALLLASNGADVTRCFARGVLR
jgi:hypothetical protein